MAKKKIKDAQQQDQQAPPIPFDEAVKRLWTSPPQPKISKKKQKKK